MSGWGDVVGTFFLNAKEDVEIPEYNIPTLHPTVTQPQQTVIPIAPT